MARLVFISLELYEDQFYIKSVLSNFVHFSLKKSSFFEVSAFISSLKKFCLGGEKIKQIGQKFKNGKKKILI